MPRARITWSVDNSELTRFRNILTRITNILDHLDKEIVDSLDIPVLQNVKQEYLKRMSVKSVKDKIDGHSNAKYCVDTKDYEDALRLLEKIYLIVDENNLSPKDFKNIDLNDLVNGDYQYTKNKQSG